MSRIICENSPVFCLYNFIEFINFFILFEYNIIKRNYFINL